jgi:hypothetical protein
MVVIVSRYSFAPTAYASVSVCIAASASTCFCVGGGGGGNVLCVAGADALSLGPAEFDGGAPAPVDVDDAVEPDADGVADEGAALVVAFADDDAAGFVPAAGACAKLFTAMPAMIAALMKPAENFLDVGRRVDFIFCPSGTAFS